MFKQIDHIMKGKHLWDKVSSSVKVDERTVVLGIAGDDRKLDLLALDYLPLFVKRKKASRAVVLTTDLFFKEVLQEHDYGFPVIIRSIDLSDLKNIYDYYCFAFNLDNIAFTFLNHCPYNFLGKILEETDIMKEEVVCLGIYWLREMPENVDHV